jgi:hypothetical protein
MAYKSVDVEDGCVSFDSLVENAKSLVVTHVHKVLALHCDLSVTIIRTTSRLNMVNLRIVIVPIF